MSDFNLPDMADDPRFIEGIFNYCDRWCERCPFTHRCMTYAMEEQTMGDKERDLSNAEFWEKMQDAFAQTKDIILEMARECGVDPDNLDTPEVEAHLTERETRRDKARRSAVARQAMDYTKMVTRWFKKKSKAFKSKGKELARQVVMDLPGADPEAVATELSDASDVIHWYQYQIYVKLQRALTGIADEEDEYPRDADGSAKVALLGIDRSIAAWSILRQHFPKSEESLLEILRHLAGLRQAVEQNFPRARAFQRPGFDIAPPPWP